MIILRVRANKKGNQRVITIPLGIKEIKSGDYVKVEKITEV